MIDHDKFDDALTWGCFGFFLGLSVAFVRYFL
jgi:hypothetical protein